VSERYPVGSQVTIGDDPTVWTISSTGPDGVVWLHRVEDRTEDDGRLASLNVMHMVRVAE
jgi:hypothetical protein